MSCSGLGSRVGVRGPLGAGVPMKMVKDKEPLSLSYWAIPSVDAPHQLDIIIRDEADVIVWQASLLIIVRTMKELEDSIENQVHRMQLLLQT